MSEHIPNSSGLPLRAMVMVLLFLGVIFLLVGFQAMGSDSDDDSQTPSTAITTTSVSAKPEAAAEKADVRVYNVSDQAGAAGQAADQLRDAGWNVTEVESLSLPDVEATTVYFGDNAGEHDAAQEVGEVLHAPVEPRIPGLAEQPPGVIVAVAG